MYCEYSHIALYEYICLCVFVCSVYVIKLATEDCSLKEKRSSEYNIMEAGETAKQ